MTQFLYNLSFYFRQPSRRLHQQAATNYAVDRQAGSAENYLDIPAILTPYFIEFSRHFIS